MVQEPIVTLTTDFGTADAYVGTMKGVILGIAPSCHLVDITHEISPHDIRAAAFVLLSMYRYFPSQTVHLAVVDPGVGTGRRAIALETSTGRFVAPDNGILSYVMLGEPRRRQVELVDPRYRLTKVGATFHGRDLFAPAAAHLASGVPLADLGPEVHDPHFLPVPRLEVGTHRVSGEVVYVDRFGNAVTSIGTLVLEDGALGLRPMFPGSPAARSISALPVDNARARVVVAGREVQGPCYTYASVEPGQCLALVGSTGCLEIAVREGDAAQALGLRPGDEVTLMWTPSG